PAVAQPMTTYYSGVMTIWTVGVSHHPFPSLGSLTAPRATRASLLAHRQDAPVRSPSATASSPSSTGFAWNRSNRSGRGQQEPRLRPQLRLRLRTWPRFWLRPRPQPWLLRLWQRLWPRFWLRPWL